LRLILQRVWERAFVLEHLAEITAIDPTAAGRAADEMLGDALGRIAHSSPEDGATGNV
jgi:7,8-dihydro-6-hydroxymethylpterin-pyrophosphokinase